MLFIYNLFIHEKRQFSVLSLTLIHGALLGFINALSLSLFCSILLFFFTSIITEISHRDHSSSSLHDLAFPALSGHMGSLSGLSNYHPPSFSSSSFRQRGLGLSFTCSQQCVFEGGFIWSDALPFSLCGNLVLGFLGLKACCSWENRERERAWWQWWWIDVNL